MRQLSFLPKVNLSHGGNTYKGKRKTARAFDPKRPMHIVMKSSRAKGQWSLLKPMNRDSVEKILDKVSHKFKIKVHRFANVGNHLHIVISIHASSYGIARTQLASFLRQFAGEIAQKVTRASKINPVGRFWDELVYSRVLTWGREFETVCRYLIKNLFEAAGYWDRKTNPDWKLISFKCAPDD